MGLDMYARSVPAEHLGDAEVDFELPDECPVEEIYYWRKHPDLHGWMEALYRQKGGAEEAFNCTPVRLREADLDALEVAVRGQQLPLTRGYFFGLSGRDEDEVAADLEFIQFARDALRNGNAVYYTSWW